MSSVSSRGVEEERTRERSSIQEKGTRGPYMLFKVSLLALKGEFVLQTVQQSRETKKKTMQH